MAVKYLYPWTSETFPQLDDLEHDLLCAAQDAEGPLTKEDLFFSTDCPLTQRDKASKAIRRLQRESLLLQVKPGYWQITSLGRLYLSSPPPEGVEV